MTADAVGGAESSGGEPNLSQWDRLRHLSISYIG